jgi:hypothetical protein
MFNVARAALLNSGVPESKLPKTHNGLIAAFGEEAVKARKLDPNLGRALSKTESLRLMADYTGHQIDQPPPRGRLHGPSCLLELSSVSLVSKDLQRSRV